MENAVIQKQTTCRMILPCAARNATLVSVFLQSWQGLQVSWEQTAEQVAALLT